MKIITLNKSVNFNYEVLETLEVGIQLLGSEVKSIRQGNISIKESFISIVNGQMILKQAFIKKFEQANTFNTINETRERVLLAKRKQIDKLLKEVEQKGNTLVPRKVYLNDKGYVKVEVVLARGKNNVDKRNTIKERDIKRETDRQLKNY